jgi:N-acetylmuramoyl-L-alanine amidase
MLQSWAEPPAGTAPAALERIAQGPVVPRPAPEPEPVQLAALPAAPSVALPAIAIEPAIETAAPLLSGKENVRKLFGLSVRTIVIDAGHGGHDPGAIGKGGLREKDLTLDIALRLKDRLEALDRDYRILLVREGDVFVPLSQRAAFANSHDADLFVSIHVNYIPGTSTNAVETYYFGRHQDVHARRVAERENRGSEYTLSEFENIVRNMQDTIKLQESKALAGSIQRSLVSSIRRQNEEVLNLGVRTAPFVVLLGVKAPSVLVEVASLSSPEGERNLRRERYRDEIATYLAGGIAGYLKEQFTQERKQHDKGKVGLAGRE